MSSNKREAVKVVLMDTQYVETDSTSFKSVVQKLTGKDSCVAWIKESSSFSKSADAKSGGSTVDDRKLELDFDRSVSNTMLPKGSMSFKDVDRLTLEVPPALPEELQWLWK